MSSPVFQTADLYDAHADRVRVAAPLFRDFGGRRTFAGPIATVRAPEDNSLVRAALEEPGKGRVLVVEGEGSLHCALVGDQLAELGRANGWSGLLVHGCIRDSQVIAQIAIGVKALATNPRKSTKRGLGERDLPLAFAGIEFHPGEHLYADPDGVLVAAEALL